MCFLDFWVFGFLKQIIFILLENFLNGGGKPFSIKVIHIEKIQVNI
jgi:hypothetical protein